MTCEHCISDIHDGRELGDRKNRNQFYSEDRSNAVAEDRQFLQQL